MNSNTNNEMNHDTRSGDTQSAEALAGQAMGFFSGMLKRQNDIHAFVAQHQPQTIPCERHPEIQRPVDYQATWRANGGNNGALVAGYAPCPTCAKAIEFAVQNDRLHSQGVPSILLHCHFGNWDPQDATEKANLAAAVRFAGLKKRVGFLVLLGKVGTGKGHLAVSVMRTFADAIFVKHSTLLRRLRQSYRDPEAADPIAECQCAGLLVLDEIGVSAGGRDELPMLQEILDYRYGERLPTILTSNLTMAQMAHAIGKRLVDRLRESAFEVLTFGGESRRDAMKAQYFDGAAAA